MGSAKSLGMAAMINQMVISRHREGLGVLVGGDEWLTNPSASGVLIFRRGNAGQMSVGMR
jgi:hypothetical protein